MKLKSYFSGTVEAAMELARQELGEDALLVNARPATPETQSLGAFEVVFGVLPAQPGGAEPPPAGDRHPRVDRLAQDVAGLKREIACMAQSLRSGRMLGAPTAASEEPALYRQLIEAELDAALARHVAGGAPLEDLFEVDAALGRPGAERAVVALIGPPGAGKTATLVKLAARYGLTSRRPAHILSADVHRVAATDQLRALASILGVGCDVVESPLALTQALEEHRSKDFVFIDTPGLARDEMEDGAELARLIASHPEMDTHLVLPASMKPADLARVIDRYEIFQPKKLLFTRLDETERFGALATEAARRSLPVSFLTAGQRIPDDLEPATKERLVSLVLGTEGERKSRGAGA
jgi:flagellar biosynthesis protein FlhF